MKKVCKLLTIVMVAVIVLGAFSGCSLFGRDVAKYRAQVMMKVGEEEITTGKVLDAYNNIFYTYQQYINAGYITADALFENVMSSLYLQYMKVDAYKTGSNAKVENHDYTGVSKNAKYLTADEMEFAISYVKHSLFTVLDNSVESDIALDYDLKAVEKDDTSREFTQPDELEEGETYAEKLYRDNFVDKDMEKYFADNYSGLSCKVLGVEEYVSKATSAKYDALKQRFEDYEDEEGNKANKDKEFLSKADYDNKCQDVANDYVNNIESSYGIGFEEFFTNQISDFVDRTIANKYSLAINGKVEVRSDLDESLAANYALIKKAKASNYNMVFDSFVTDIANLGTGYIYDVPDEYAGDFIFVKNILVPFDKEQLAKLNSVYTALATSDSKAYIQERNALASAIKATNFLDKDAEPEQLFELDGEFNVVVKQDSTLGNYLKADGSVVAMEGKTQDETIIELMKMYNTDTAQHTATYDYVVRVKDIPSTYTAPWVTEFSDAAIKASELGEKHYAVCVSSYGIHVVYYTKAITSADALMNFDNKYDTTSDEYRFFKTYYADQVKIYTTEAEKELDKEYKAGGKIVPTGEFKKFLSDASLSYNFEEAMKVED